MSSQFAQELVDALGVLSAPVELEVEFRSPAEAQAATETAADETGRAADRPDRILAFRVAAQHGKLDARMGAVGAEREIGDARQRGSGVLDLPSQDVRQLPAQQVARTGLGDRFHGIRG